MLRNVTALALLLVVSAGLWLLRSSRDPVTAGEPVPGREPSAPAADAPAAPGDLRGMEGSSSEPRRRDVGFDGSREGPVVAGERGTVLMGVLRDVERGGGVPDYQLRLEDEGGEAVVLETDEEGRFRSETRIHGGVWKVIFVDHPGIARRTEPARTLVVREDEPEQEEDLGIHVGPTFALRIEGKAGPWHAALRSANRSHPMTLCSADGRFGGMEAPVRGEMERPWVRFPVPLERPIEGAGTWQIFVADVENTALGFGEVGAIDGSVVDPVSIPMRPTGTLKVVPNTGSGRSVQGVVLRLDSEGAESVFADPDVIWGDEAAALDHYLFLEPGVWTLRVWGDGFETGIRTIVVVGGETVTTEVELIPSPGGLRTIEVVATTTSGRAPSKVAVSVLPEEGFHILRGTLEWSDENGESVGRFTAKDLAAGRYSVTLEPDAGWIVSPGRVRAGAAEGVLRFKIDDLADRRSFTFQGMDGETGELLGDTWIQLDLVDRDMRYGGTGAIQLTDVPLRPACRWLLTCEGYVPVGGRIEEPMGTPAGEPVKFVVPMNRGWGAELHCMETTHAPLEGVRVLVDGSPAGVSDADGILVLERRERPRRVDVRFDGWILHGDGAAALDGLTDGGRIGLCPVLFERE